MKFSNKIASLHKKNGYFTSFPHFNRLMIAFYFAIDHTKHLSLLLHTCSNKDYRHRGNNHRSNELV